METLPAHPQGGEGGVSRTITHDELVTALAGRALTLVDVLPTESYRGGHIPRAVSLPLADLPSRAPAVLPEPSRPIAVYCGGFT